MIQRSFWKETVAGGWRVRSIVWLTGVRRIGKTSLARQLGEATYFNCDRPSVQRELSDPEFFLAGCPKGRPVILDEVHRLDEPTTLLKLAADEHLDLQILATGSSTLAATHAFRDTLSGRKMSVRLLPVLWRERNAFDVENLDVRLLRGGFPETLLGTTDRHVFFDEWLESYYARDIAELFNIRNRTGFLRLVQLLLRRSAGQLDMTNLSKESGVSRPTAISYLDAIEISNVAFKLRPYHGGSAREVVKRPKVYGFDTGAVAWVCGWDSIRESDRGLLWEHLVFDELRSIVSDRRLYYWRDKSGREVDFIVDRGDGKVDTVEAKIDPERIDLRNLRAFRALYPEGANYLAVPYAERPRRLRLEDIEIIICEPASVPAGRL